VKTENCLTPWLALILPLDTCMYKNSLQSSFPCSFYFNHSYFMSFSMLHQWKSVRGLADWTSIVVNMVVNSIIHPYSLLFTANMSWNWTIQFSNSQASLRLRFQLVLETTFCRCTSNCQIPGFQGIELWTGTAHVISSLRPWVVLLPTGLSQSHDSVTYLLLSLNQNPGYLQSSLVISLKAKFH
jgi:hypothetical protein